MKYGRCSIMVWGCMSAAGVGQMHFIAGVMRHKPNIQIVKDKLSLGPRN